MPRNAIRAVSLVLLAAYCPAVQAQGGPAAAASQAPAAFEIAAAVDGSPVYQYEVARVLERTFGEREIAPSALPTLRRKALDQLIDQRLIVKAIGDRPQLASEADYQRAWSNMLQELADRDTTLPQYLQQSGRAEAELRHAVRWQLAWAAALEHYATDANLQKYFDRHRRDFDGTRLRLAQIFWKLDAQGDPEDREAVLEYAARLRRKIQDKQIAFAEAAREYSQSPSAREGGEIGWIERDRPMPEAFSQAAYRLEVGEVGEPVVTPLGVHLITVLEEKPGQRQWHEARDKLQLAVRQYLFRYLADAQRPNSTIEIIAGDP